MKSNLAQRTIAEGLGTALLLAAVIGSGIMGERLAGGNVAIALLANTIATGTVLAALILALGPISGAFLPGLVQRDIGAAGALARLGPGRIAVPGDEQFRHFESMS